MSAVELGPLGIRVNCVAPGAIEIERTKLEELERLGGKDFVDDLVQQFLGDSVDVLRDLTQAVQSSDVDEFRELAHALRSGAANIGARGIYEMCLAWRQIDSAALSADGDSYVQALEDEFNRVRAELREDVAA